MLILQVPATQIKLLAGTEKYYRTLPRDIGPVVKLIRLHGRAFQHPFWEGVVFSSANSPSFLRFGGGDGFLWVLCISLSCWSVLLLRHSQLKNDYLGFSRSVSSDFCFSGVSFKHQFLLRGTKTLAWIVCFSVWGRNLYKSFFPVFFLIKFNSQEEYLG